MLDWKVVNDLGMHIKNWANLGETRYLSSFCGYRIPPVDLFGENLRTTEKESDMMIYTYQDMII